MDATGGYHDWIDKALARMNAALARTSMSQREDLIKKSIEDADLAFAVFRDPTSADKADTLLMCIKGMRKLDEIVERPLPNSFKLAAIPCRDPETAAILNEKYGDKD